MNLQDSDSGKDGDIERKEQVDIVSESKAFLNVRFDDHLEGSTKQVQNHRHTAYGNISLFAPSEDELSGLSATSESPLLREPPFQFSMESWLITGMCGLLLLLITVVCCAVRCRGRGSADRVDTLHELQLLDCRKKVVMVMSKVRWHVLFLIFYTFYVLCVNNCESPTQVSLICLLQLVVY